MVNFMLWEFCLEIQMEGKFPQNETTLCYFIVYHLQLYR